MMKALLVVVTMTGSEYNVNMPDMETCMEQARVVSSQGIAELKLFVYPEQMRVQGSESFSVYSET